MISAVGWSLDPSGIYQRLADAVFLKNADELDQWEKDDDVSEYGYEPVNNGVDLEAALEVGLLQAVAANDVETVNNLIAQGAAVDCQDSVTMSNALHIACCFGHIEVGHILIRAGIDTEAINIEGQMPVDVAKDHGHNDMVCMIMLIEYTS